MTLIDILTAIHDSGVGTAVRESDWMFPTFESIHVVFLTLVFGSIILLDLRLTGLGFRGRSVSDVTRDVMVWTWVGFLGVRIPFSAPPEEAKGAGRGLWLIGAMLVSFAVAGLGMLAWSYDWFLQLIAAEILVVAVLYLAMRASLSARKWEALED